MAQSPSSSDELPPAPEGSGAGVGPLRIELRASVPGAEPRAADASVATAWVVVEPLYGATAAGLALDAGWGSVELAVEAGAGVAPIPLVSFEQPPGAEHRGGRCRVRSGGVVAALDALAGEGAADGALVLLGAPTLARPLCARLAMTPIDRVVLVPAPSAAGELSSDSWWAAGMLARVLLDELEVRGAVLDDAAGVAVALATGEQDARGAIGAGARWVAHVAAGGSDDDLRVAAAIDSVAVVPRVRLGAAPHVAEAWGWEA